MNAALPGCALSKLALLRASFFLVTAALLFVSLSRVLYQHAPVLAGSFDFSQQNAALALSTPHNDSRPPFSRCAIRSLLQNASHKPIKHHCLHGPFGDASPQPIRRIAVLIRGESFRGSTGWADRHIDVGEETFRCQALASESHVKHLITDFESCDYGVDVFLKTWRAHSTDWGGENSSEQLINMYGGRVVQSQFDVISKKTDWLFAHGDPQALHYTQGIKMVAKYSKVTGITYDAILVIRFDLIFKQPFGDVQYNKWLLAFRTDTRVADTIQWIPWKFANCAAAEGFRSDSDGITERIGRSSMAYLTTGKHYSNTMADRNPIYLQCRPEQKFDISGGFSILIFSLGPISANVLHRSGSSVKSTLCSQGSPRGVVPLDLVMHMWNNGSAQKGGSVKQAAKDCFGPGLSAMRVSNLTKSGHETGWQAAFASLRETIHMVTQTIAFGDGMRVSQTFFHQRYTLDRLVFARSDYTLTLPFISAYKCDTVREVCVGYGAKLFPQVPILIISSQAAGKRFAGKSQQLEQLVQGENATGFGWNATSINITRFLMEAFGLPVAVICDKC